MLILKIICEQKNHVNLHHIESRPSKENKDCYEFFVACDNVCGGLHGAIEDLRKHTMHLQVLSRNPQAQSDEGILLFFPLLHPFLCFVLFFVLLLAFWFFSFVFWSSFYKKQFGLKLSAHVLTVHILFDAFVLSAKCIWLKGWEFGLMVCACVCVHVCVCVCAHAHTHVCMHTDT